jgi:hypothetical protein
MAVKEGVDDAHQPPHLFGVHSIVRSVHILAEHDSSHVPGENRVGVFQFFMGATLLLMSSAAFMSRGGLTKNNVFGAFKFDANPIGLQYFVSGQGYYPGIEAYVNLRNYTIFSVNLTLTEPTSGRASPTVTNLWSSAVTYNANFSTAKDEFNIYIAQSSTDIEATYRIFSSSGTILQTWTLDQSYSGVSSPPPYPHYVASDELDGLETVGYAHVLSGTDFQIESVINTAATDFTHYQNVSYTGASNAFSITNCGLSSYVDEEGDDMTLPSVSSHNNNGVDEAWQYVKVT